MYINFERLNKRGTELSELDDNKISDQRDVKEVKLASQASGLERCQCTVKFIFFIKVWGFSLNLINETKGRTGV